MPINPRESGRLIFQNAKHIKISNEAINAVSSIILADFIAGDFSINTYSSEPLHPDCVDEFVAANWIFVVDCLNFCFWVESSNFEDHFVVKYKEKRYTGYWALCAAIWKAIDKGIPILNANFRANISLDDVRTIFQSDTLVEIPLIEKRWEILRESGRLLQEKFDGNFLNCIKAANHSAEKLCNLLVENFPNFRDEATYCGQTVSFYKRAQITVADIYLCWKGKGIGSMTDIEFLTMFADYRIPQTLVYLDVFSYSTALLEKITSKQLINNGDEFEVEIRGCSIYGVDQIVNAIKSQLDKFHQPVEVNAVIVDNWLWEHGRKHSYVVRDSPFHRTRSQFY